MYIHEYLNGINFYYNVDTKELRIYQTDIFDITLKTEDTIKLSNFFQALLLNNLHFKNLKI